MTAPKIKFSGHSESGKTSLITRVIEELRQRGHTVGVLKHDPHGHWEWDKEGTDTDRYTEAGADAVSILSPNRHGLYQSHQESLDVDDLIAKMDPKPDLVLLEGFKSRSFPGFTATDGHWEDHTGESFDHGSIETITDRVEQLADLEASSYGDGNTTCRLTIDGEPVPLKRFPKSALVEVLEGYVRSLNGVTPGGQMTVEIDHH